MKQNQQVPARYPRERKHRRFNLQFPVWLTFPSSGKVWELPAVSKNVSTGGLLLKTIDPIPPHTRVSLTMEVQGPWSRRPVRLQGEGEVVRVEKLEADTGFAIAIECRQPISEIENNLPADEGRLFVK